LVVEIDSEIARLSRALIPKSVDVRVPLYPPHISVVRKQIPTRLDYWSKYEGQIIELDYCPWIFNDATYWWLNVFSKRLEDIRVELGLEAHSQWSMPPDGKRCFHITVGNTKER
jgi:hypothetical protein